MADTTPAAFYTLLCLAGGVIVLLKLTKAVCSRRATALNLPPGPWPLPVIGNMHSLLGALPHHAMRGLARRYGAVMLLRLGHVPTVVVSSPEAAREVLKTHDAILANRPLYATMGIFTYGGRDIAFAPCRSRHWKELRRLCVTELLGPKPVLSFRPIREEESASLVRAAAAASPAAVNVSERVKVLTNDILMRCAVGDRCPMRDEYIPELEAALEVMAGFNLIDLFPASWLARTLGAGSLRAAREVHDRLHLHRITHAIIEYHESRGVGVAGAATDDGTGKSRREDILDMLLRFQKDGGLGITLTTEVLSGVLFVSSRLSLTSHLDP